MGGTADAAVEANSGILDVNDLDENDTNELFSYYASKFEEETEVDAKNRKSVDPLAADPALSDMKPIGSSANGQPVVDDGRGIIVAPKATADGSAAVMRLSATTSGLSA